MMVIKQLLSRPRNWAGCNCGALYHSELFPGGDKKNLIIIGSSRSFFWGIELHHLFPFLFFFWPFFLFFSMLTGLALAPFPVIAPHPFSSIISSWWAHWFGKWLYSLCLRGRTDTMIWNSIGVLNQTRSKLFFMVRSYAIPSNKHRF